MQDTGNKGEGERSVFTYTTDSESRSFRSIVQNIQARIAKEILVSDVRSEREDERSVFTYVTESESRSIGRKRPRFC